MIIPLNASLCTSNSDTGLSNMMLDDDSSTCSTMAVLDMKSLLAATSSEPVAPAAATSSLKKKSVRFNQDANEFYTNTQLCKEDCAELWYNAAEYRHFKATIKFLAQEINNYESKSVDPFSYQRIVLRTYEACCQSSNDGSSTSVLTSMEEQHLKRWLQGSPMRCGLEFVAIQDLSRGRYARRQNILQVVMDFQNEMDLSAEDGDEPTQYLREACEAVSRPSRMFAQHLAQAAAPQPASLY